MPKGYNKTGQKINMKYSSLLVDYTDLRPRCLKCEVGMSEISICHHCQKAMGFWDVDMAVAGFKKKWLTTAWRTEQIEGVDYEDVA